MLAAALGRGIGYHGAHQDAVVVPRDRDRAQRQCGRTQRRCDVVVRAAGLVLERMARQAQSSGHGVQFVQCVGHQVGPVLAAP